ncbi:MAG: hypothetical protein K2I96_22920 [Lachnospiraceae bacterium]|nr:hypothetical protein [Lachnospiraceae bacterium]
MNDTVYTSIFKKELQDLVDLKKALGFAYQTEACAFRRIDSFFIENGLSGKCITKELCELWCHKRSHESAANQAARISTFRVFCSYLNDIGLPAYIPPKGFVRKCARYDAHIYTDEELKKFFAAVDRNQSAPGECPYRSEVSVLSDIIPEFVNRHIVYSACSFIGTDSFVSGIHVVLG